MAQETNLNVSPYYDDYYPSSDYYRVLFKPGYPVQSRELTTLQSILQSQIERFGQHFFKEGGKVIPGNIGYNSLYYCIELQNSFSGVPISYYAQSIVGTKITGVSSGVSAIVDKVLSPELSERGNVTLYISFLNSSTTNNSTQEFLDGEELVCDKDIVTNLLGNPLITAGEPFAVTKSENCNSIGSSFNISEGVYFIRGHFVNVATETLILDQYTNKSNYRVGLYINEEIVTSDIDDTLNDNSQGYNNYSAPGADRLKISVSLYKKPLDDFDDKNFIQLVVIENGVIKKEKNTTSYNQIADEFARRTYDESGDYTVTPFNISIKESLNNNIGNKGIYQEGKLTSGGIPAAESLGVYQLSPAKAYVRGYEVDVQKTTNVDFEKTRSTKTLSDQSLTYGTGFSLLLNRVYGVPDIGFNNSYIVSLRDERISSSNTTISGNEIGLARVYDFSLDSDYNSNSTLNRWKISLYDIQLFTKIEVNENVSLSVPTFVEGQNSGATGFIVSSVSNSKNITLYSTKGNFIINEPLYFDGIDSSRVITKIEKNNISDVKSIYNSGSTVKFSGDVVQSKFKQIGNATIKAKSSGESEVTSLNFPKNIKVGNLVQFSDKVSTLPVIAKVTNISTLSSNKIKIAEITAVADLYVSTLPTSGNLEVNDFKIISSGILSSSDNTLYTALPHSNISNLDLDKSTLTIRKKYTVNISSNQLSTVVVADTDETFLPFDNERYILIRSDGGIENLSSDKVKITNGGKNLQIYNLGSNNNSATLITTIRKINPKAKVKRKNRVNSIIINKSNNVSSGIGGTTLNDGLQYGNYPYGTRVQDKIISLNVPEVTKIYGVFESLDTSDPKSPLMTLSNIVNSTGTTNDIIIGEKIKGLNSNCIAIVCEKTTDTQIGFITLNEDSFSEGEPVVFEESNTQANITSIESNSLNISFNYNYNSGQKSNLYDISTLSKKADVESPSRQIKIYFENLYFDSTDTGDITTVNSYSLLDYKEIKTVNNIRLSDIIDTRPRVNGYSSISEGQRSPLEFYGRSITQTSNSAKNILKSDESILASYSFYLGRIDRIYLSKNGKIQVINGEPSEDPQKPKGLEDCLEIASVSLPPYLYNTSDASIEILNHKRYRMADIKKLEDRIKSLEYYTSLSLLESNTSNLFIPDSEGLNRFKSGFFVDNFTGFLAQEDKLEIKNSIDIRKKELRPKHYTTSVDLITGPVENTSSSDDLAFTIPEGTNIRRNEDIITLDYAEVEWLNQPFATRAESVTPFLISFWQGTLEITPSSDTWSDTVRIEPKVTQTEGNYASTLAIAAETFNVDPQTGFAPTVWESWVDNWTGRSVSTTRSTSSSTSTSLNTWTGGRQPRIETTTTTVSELTFQTVTETGTSTRQGTTTAVVEQFDQISLGDSTVSKDLVPFMRSRNIQFISKKLKPLTRIYAFFDGIDVTKYCFPKLLEINMISGIFEVGETIVGKVLNTSLLEENEELPSIRFRAAQPNHKEGEYNSPSETYTQSPYNNQPIQSSYSSTSTILNVDTYSLSNEPQGNYYGWVREGMTLYGEKSGAQATITNLRLITDITSFLGGSFFIPNPNINVHPKFETGVKTFTLIDDQNNNQNLCVTIAEENYTASGTLETIQENIVSIRNARIEQKQEFEERSISRTGNSTLVGTRIISQTSSQRQVGWYDPLAQSFLVDDEEGVFLTSCDVFFKTKDDKDIPVTFQLRTMVNGYPTQYVIPFSEIVVFPKDIETSGDGSVATTFNFKAPIYLEGGREYCICLASISTKYSVYISRIGENDILTQSFISNQPYLGSLFKSQNASTWEASQWEDLKFTLYRADFITSGTLDLYNPELSLGNNQVSKLLPNSLSFRSRKLLIELSSALTNTNLVEGNTIIQYGNSAYGNYVGNTGKISESALTIVNAGIGYIPATGSQTFNNVNLKTITGNGKNAKATIVVNNGSIQSATIDDGGNGYKVGDILAIESIGTNNVGLNARFSVHSLQSTTGIILDNVQGEFIKNNSDNYLEFKVSDTTSSPINSSSDKLHITSIKVLSDGLEIKVNHKNHGMYFENNKVRISGVRSDIKPTKLNSSVTSDFTGAFSVENSSEFSTFEGIPVNNSNPGYMLINDEIIEYTSVTTGSIGGVILRGTNAKNYSTGTPVYKYELNGVSLKRINKIHSIKSPYAFDHYFLELNTSTDGVNRSQSANSSTIPSLYFDKKISSGGRNIKASKNIPFEVITPVIQTMTVQGTSILAEMRSITGKSIDGQEVPYLDNGYEKINLNTPNYLDTPRLIASKLNEDENLGNITGNKSLNIRMFLSSTNSKLSPVIDTQRISSIFTSNKVNSPIVNYIEDYRVNTIDEDPTSTQYISKEIVLENPASSLQVMISSYINIYSDIRVFYAISENEGFDPIFVPFPGHKNLDSNGSVIDIKNSDGSSDSNIPKTNTLSTKPDNLEFKEYKFSIDDLPNFKSYRIKILLSGKNQVYVPRIKELRTIALA